LSQWALIGVLALLSGVSAGRYPHFQEDALVGPAVHAAPAFGDRRGDHGEVAHHEYLPQPHAFQFAYEVKDGHGNTRHHKEESDVHNNRKGSYGYHDANGVYRVVNYVADKRGFRAWIRTNEPGTANQNPAGVHITAEDPPPHVIEAAAAKPAHQEEEPPHHHEPEDFESARPVVAAIPAFTHPGTLPIHTVHPAGAVAAPEVAAVPAFHHPNRGGHRVHEVDGLAPAHGGSAAAATHSGYPGPGPARLHKFTLNDARVYEGSHDQLPHHGYGGSHSPHSVVENRASNGPYYYQPVEQAPQYKYGARAHAPQEPKHGYYPQIPSHVTESAPSVVPVYKSIRNFPKLQSSGGDADYPEVESTKHGIPVGVTYIRNPEPQPSFRRAASFDIEPSGVASRYEKYLSWNRQGKLRD
ncbi:unnamed protein product, partial [Ixodes hexagonus]